MSKKEKEILKETPVTEAPAQEPEVVIDVKNLSVGFTVRGKKINVIRNIDLKVYRGETLAIVGESGSGKSVTTKTFTGMLEKNGAVTSGSIMFDGMDLAKFKTDKDWKPIRGKRIATIFQDPMTSLNPLLTIGFQISEVLRLHHGLSKAEAKEEAIKLLKKVRIPNAEARYDDYPFQYSGGMRQRVVIAIALACRPEILICDEPTTALDVTVQAQIIALIKELQEEYHWTTIFITHDLGVVANVANRIAVMYGGQIVEYGTVEEVFYEPAHPYTWALLCSLPQLGSKEEALSYIKGNPPSFSSEIIGDAFAPRNEYAMNIDFVKEPPMFQISPTHCAKTWLLDPRAPKVEKPKVIQELHERMKRAAEELKRQEGSFDD
jgi:oligopeptide transport system ATP-binding protein